MIKFGKAHPPLRLAAMIAMTAIVSVAGACSSDTANKEAGAPAGSSGYRIETLVPGGPMHGAKGIEFGPDGLLYVGSVLSQTIYSVDVATGEVRIAVAAPDGEADDLAFSADGMMAWSALLSGEIRGRRTDGTVFTIAKELPLINPVGFTSDGRLFAAQIGFDRLHEIDTTGQNPPRLVAKGIGHLNSFEIAGDDQIVGPLAGIGTVARVDIESGAVSPIAEDLDTISAVNLDSQGRIYAVAWSVGDLLRIDQDTGATTLIAQLEPPLDNLAIAADDMIYVSQPARSRIVSVDPDTSKVEEIVPGNLSVPGGLAVTQLDGRETLVVADDVGFRWVDAETGAVSATIDLSDFTYPGAATDVAVNDEFVVLTNLIQSRVYRIDRRSGETTHKWIGIEAPYGAVLSDTGEPIFAEFASGQIIRLSTTDRKSREVVADDLGGPVGIAWAGPNAVYVTEATAGRVTHIDLSDGRKTIIGEDLEQPEGLAVLDDGRLVVVEVGARRVIAVDPATGARDVIAADLPLGQAVPNTPSPVYVTSGIAVGENGVVYLSVDREHSVIKLVPNG